MATPAQPAQLTDLLDKLRRHWRVLGVAALIGAVLGVLASIAIPDSYSAESRVSVNPMSSNPLATSAGSVSMPTEEQVVTSRTVAAAAAELLEPQYGFTPEEVQDATSVVTPESSLVLGITFTGNSPTQAAAGADAVAEAYLTDRRATAEEELQRRSEAAEDQLEALQARADGASDIEAQTISVQVQALANQLAMLGNVDLTPGTVIGQAEVPTSPSSPGALPLGVAGAFLGVLIGAPVALARREDDTEIGGVDGLRSLGDQIVLDGTADSHRGETWDVAAFMLKIPEDPTDGFVVLVDAVDDPDRIVSVGQELVDALQRRGRTAHVVDAGSVDADTINRGWPTDKRQGSWAGEVVVIDSTGVTDDPTTVVLAGRSDAVVLARTTTDDAAALRRLAGMMRAKNVDITLSALFPPRPAFRA